MLQVLPGTRWPLSDARPGWVRPDQHAAAHWSCPPIPGESWPLLNFQWTDVQCLAGSALLQRYYTLAV